MVSRELYSGSGRIKSLASIITGVRCGGGSARRRAIEQSKKDVALAASFGLESVEFGAGLSDRFSQ